MMHSVGKSKRRLLGLLALFGCVLWSLTSVAQDVARFEQTPETNFEIENTCEFNIARLNKLHVEAGDNLVIAIARLGDGERSRVRNWRRLSNASLYLTRVRGRSPSTVILAEGQRARGRGRIEMYVNGRLADVFGFGRDEDFAVGSCDGTGKFDRLYYGKHLLKTR